MIIARWASDVDPASGLFLAMEQLRQMRFVRTARYLPLFKMKVGTTLPAIRGLDCFRLPLNIITMGASNLNPRFSSHSELLAGTSFLFHPGHQLTSVKNCLRRSVCFTIFPQADVTADDCRRGIQFGQKPGKSEQCRIQVRHVTSTSKSTKSDLEP